MNNKNQSSIRFGLDNPHPLSTMKTELIWEGKYDEYGNRRTVDVAGWAMPPQKIETIDQPRAEALAQGNLWDESSALADDFRNMLIWGDNKLVMASLLKDFKGKIQLIYIDPPFDVGQDFRTEIPVGEEGESITKDQSLIEMVAYRDMWGNGTDSYIHMMYERILLMSELLTESGSIYVHCDPRVNPYLRALLDEILGQKNFVNQIVWKRTFSHSDVGQGAKHMGRLHDYIIVYRKSESTKLNVVYTPYTEKYVKDFYKYEDADGRKYRLVSLLGPGGAAKGNPSYEFLGVTRYWVHAKEKMEQLYKDGMIIQTRPGTVPQKKRYIDQSPGVPLQDIWTDVAAVQGGALENVNYPTQKPEELLRRIILSSSDEGDIVADFFCGSGTTGAVAETHGRRWLMSDLGRFAVHTSRKRLIELQRTQHREKRPYRAFDVYNLGRYERQWWFKKLVTEDAEVDHRRVVLGFYKAEALPDPTPLIHGRKGQALVFVDHIDTILTRDQVDEVAKAAREFGAKEVHMLSWEFEMDLRLIADAAEAREGVKIKLVPIPREIMEKNRKEPPPFLEVAVLEAEPIITKSKDISLVDIKLTKFRPSLAEVPSKELEALQERAIKSGFDFIDFWSVDFDFKEGKAFNHQWQDYRTRKDRSLKTVSEAKYVYPNSGTYHACVKVVDVFGCDTSITVEVKV